jgi:hypothetical protein
MSTSVLMFLLIVVGIGAALLLLRTNGRAPKKSLKTATGNTAAPLKAAAKPKNPYRATSIKIRDDACAAAKALQHKRFLTVGEVVPNLPLPDCDAASCGCTYAHHEDRRDPDDVRRGPTGLRTALHTHSDNTERRSKKRGRRATDLE